MLSRNKAKAQPANLEHQRLTSLINSMADGVIALDKQMNVVIYNGAALNVLDVNNSITGKALHEIVQPFDKNGQRVDIESLVKKSTTPQSHRDLLLHYSDGSKVNLYLSIAPVHLGYGQGGQRGFVLLIRDITREKSLEEERDEFISVVSHELRTPIAVAEGNVSNALFLLQKTGDVSQVEHALKESHQQILFLASMVNDLATLSRAERGKLTVEIEPINVENLLEELLRSYLPGAKDKDLTIKIAKNKNALPTLHSSTLYVREILQNFITNAIKYTDKGTVTLAAEPAEKGITFIVKDTGIGISKSDREKIFDKFFRSEDYRTRRNNGTGLGLYVTLKLSRLLHAEIDVESELNKGSTFKVTIPDLGDE